MTSAGHHLRNLCAVARPARYGFKDQTLLDDSVRDTWKIAKSRVKIDQRRWNKTLLPSSSNSIATSDSPKAAA